MTKGDAAHVVGATRGDAALRALGVARLVLPIPFVEAGGTVNVYLIDNPDGSLTLWDAGLGTAEARQALVQGFAAVGRELAEVRRIVVSHGHIDHYGAARFVRDRSGARIFVHPRDAAKILAGEDERGQRETLGRYFVRLGVPEEAIVRMDEAHRPERRLAEQLEEAEPLVDGQELAFRHFTGVIVPMPGHTPGLVCLHAPAARLMFSGDHLLARISPNPLLELGARGEEDKFRALAAYLASARRLGALDLEWILPGHGAPFTGHRRILRGLEAFYERRQAKILKALAAAPRTPYELVLDVFHRARDLELFLMLSEIVGNLEVLEARGAVERVADEVPYRYRPAAA